MTPKTPKKKVKKIWVAMSTPFQANFFAPLIKNLENEGYEFLVTPRNHDHIFSILKAKKIDFVPVGRHGGKELPDKLEAYAQTIEEMIPIVRREKPDLLLTERWPEAVRVAFGFDIPAWTIFYDERESHVNQMVFPISSKVFAPKFYTLQDLYRNGVSDPEKIVWFNGFHTCYLKGEPPNTDNAYSKLGLKPPIVLVRPEPEFATYFPSHKPVLETTVSNIAKSGIASVVVMPRTESQMIKYRRMDIPIIDESTSMCPVGNADLALGAAETMLMEALVLGKPAVSAIYWTLSKPVVELHRYIPHSTDPKQLTDHVERLLGSDETKSFKEKASLLVRNMDNPISIMINEIKKLNMDEEEVQLKRRSRMEILLDIIQASSVQPLRPTHIMRAANISYNELKSIVDSLETKGLITSEETFGGRYYQATSDGLRLLEEYRSFRDRLFGA